MFGSARSLSVQQYGDYTVILAQGPADILSVLDQVPVSRRPQRTKSLEAMIQFYMNYYPHDTFVLGCFNGEVKPKHPITVSYAPRNPNVMTVPGLDGHDGGLPKIGEPMYRGFRVAFGVAGRKLPFRPFYGDAVVDNEPWAPETVTGFFDNRPDGLNGDYVVPIKYVKKGWSGQKLAGKLQ